MREHLLGTPRGAMLPVHVPVLIPCPLRGLKDHRGPWDPSCDRQGRDHHQPWPLARWCVDPRPLCCKLPWQRTGMVLVHAGLSEGHFRPLQAAIGGAVRSCLTQGASSCQDTILAFLQGRTPFPRAMRHAPSRQRPPQRPRRESDMRGLDEIRPQFPHTDTWARSMRGPSIRTHDGWEMHGSTTLEFPTRLRSWGLEGVPRVTRRGHTALAREVPHIQTLGWAPCGIPGRYCLRVLPLINMECEVHDPLFPGWRKVFPLQRPSDDLPVGVEHGDGWRYRYQSVYG
jgi:hypothetical protein